MWKIYLILNENSVKSVLKSEKRTTVRVVKCHLFLLYYWRQVHIIKITSTRPEVFYKKGILKHFAKFIGKHLFQSLCFDNIASMKATTLLKKKNSCTAIFLWILRNFSEELLYRSTPGDCFCIAMYVFLFILWL